MEEDYADIYYVDSRNAVVDHRTGRTGGGGSWFRPRPPVSTVRPARVPPTRTVYVPPQPAAYPQSFAQPVYPTAQPELLYGPQPFGAAALFGRLTTGQIVEMIAQGFAAMQSLPGAPVATRDLETDIANMVLYQGALASHAKRDEQWRTLGGLIAKLVG